jgi:hypothetical protein
MVEYICIRTAWWSHRSTFLTRKKENGWKDKRKEEKPKRCVNHFYFKWPCHATCDDFRDTISSRRSSSCVSVVTYDPALCGIYSRSFRNKTSASFSISFTWEISYLWQSNQTDSEQKFVYTIFDCSSVQYVREEWRLRFRCVKVSITFCSPPLSGSYLQFRISISYRTGGLYLK